MIYPTTCKYTDRADGSCVNGKEIFQHRQTSHRHPSLRQSSTVGKRPPMPSAAKSVPASNTLFASTGLSVSLADVDERRVASL